MKAQRMLLSLAAAVVGMIVPSLASAAPPSPAPTTTQLLTGPDAPTWRRAWALGDRKGRARQRRRWPKV